MNEGGASDIDSSIYPRLERTSSEIYVLLNLLKFTCGNEVHISITAVSPLVSGGGPVSD